MSAKKRTSRDRQTIPSPHDTFVKEILSRKENARDFFSHYLPEPIRAMVDLNSLEIAKDSFIEKELKEYFSDMLYKLRLSGSGIQPGAQRGYLYVLFEHKSYPEWWVAFHLLRSQVHIWKLFLKQNKRARGLPPIVPLVLYHGNRR
jgi:predicted transposase/invertase (TIGR01784 family)